MKILKPGLKGPAFSLGIFGGHLDHDDFGLNQSKIMKRDRFNKLERDAGGKPLHTFPHPALACGHLNPCGPRQAG
jgi:hypothetical protein